MAINFPNSPATNDTFVGPTGIEYIYDGVKWRSFKPTEPVIGTFNANSAISLTAGGTNQNITLTPSGTGIVTVPSSVGIGTTTPASKLHVATTDGAAPVNTSGSNALRLRSTATAAVGVGPSILFEGQTGNTTANYGFAAIQAFKGSGTVGDYSGALAFYTQNSGGATGLTERMRIDNAGNIGIGTTSSSGYRVAVVGSAVSSIPLYLHSDASAAYVYSPNPVYIGSTGAFNLALVTNNTLRFSIGSAGQFGIGGANYGTSGQTIVSAGSAAAPAWGTLPVAGGGTGVTSSTGTGSVVLSAAPAFTGNTTFNTNTLVIDATNSRVGIGNTTPTRPLDIYGTSATIGIVNTTAVTGGTLSVDAPNSGIAQIDVAGANVLRLNTNSIERVRVNSAANSVSIGTATSFAHTTTVSAIDLGTAGGVNYVDASSLNLVVNGYWNGTNWIYKTTNPSSILQCDITGKISAYTAVSGTAAANIAYVERTRVDVSGNKYITSGNFWQYTPNPTALAAGANAITAAQLQGQIFTVAAAITTAVTFTLPLATALDTLFAQVPTTNIGFDFYIINAGVTSAAVTVAVNTGITLGAGSLTVAIGTSAQFRLRRTAANTYLLYRMG